jgi:putative transposase
MTEYLAQFFTATILEWKPLLQQEKYKNIIVNSLSFLVKDKRVIVYAFIIMSNLFISFGKYRKGLRKKLFKETF